MTTRRLLAGLAGIAVLPALAACGGNEAQQPTEPGAATAFVVGARANMPPPRLDGDALAAVGRAVDAEALVSVVIADGEPTVAESAWFRIKGATEVARELSGQENREAIERAVASVRADDEQTDLLTALDLAARELSAVQGPRELVVVDSGLSTVGPLDFTRPGMLDAEPAEVVADLEAADMLPDLCGIQVTVQGIGDTAAPQESLDIAQRRHLVAIWEAVLLASCANELEFVETALAGDPYDGVPAVTPVPLPEPTVCTSTTVVLTGGEVAFEPDSATFRDAAAARAVLQPIAAQLVDGDATATVTGTTANLGDMAGQQALSRDRAQAVVSELVALGVPAGSLEARGVGSDFDGYVPDGGPGGPLDPAAAAQNRKVVLELLTGTLTCE